MHDCIIKESLKLNFKSYDISVGGSVGVINFKEGFGSELFEFIETKYWILNPYVFNFYLFFEKYLKKYKPLIAKYLMKFKKIKP
jgi:lipid II:glycine glycyltransferase (peptidoglycan interpeptide bridge formation enzyme)